MTSYDTVITDGPSREQLFDSCRLGSEHSGRMFCHFAFAVHHTATREKVSQGSFKGDIIGLHRGGFDSYYWQVKVFIASWDPEGLKSLQLIEAIWPGHVATVNYDTQRRKGAVKQKE